jgi:hypothetical protein
MTRPCSICCRADVAEIDAVINDASYRDLALRFSVSKSALARHRPHLAKAVHKAESEPEAVLDRLRRFDQEMDEVVRGILEVPRTPLPPPAARISKRKTASRRRPTTLSRLKKC